MKALRIIKYNEVHEDAASRKIKSLHYVQFPVRRESVGWQTLGMLPGGVEAKGVYVELVEFAAKCPIRGVLATEQRPYSITQIATLIRVPLDALERAVDLFTHEDVGFVDWIDWPIDDRLVESTATNRGVMSRIIRPISLDPDGGLIDYEGNPLDPGSSETAIGSNEDRAKPPLDRTKRHNENGNGNEHEKERKLNENGNGSAGKPADDFSCSRSADRDRAWMRFQLAVAPLLGRRGGSRMPKNSSEYRGDETCARQMFDEAWPEHGDPDREALDRLTALVVGAARPSTLKPLAWMQSELKRQAGGVK